MRRKAKPGVRRLIGPPQHRVREALDSDQLKNYAGCCLEWNLIENAINSAVVISLKIPGPLRQEVASRINGIEGKVAIIKAALKIFLCFSDADYICFADIFGRALLLKKYRDGIAHARPMYAHQDVAPTVMNRGELHETLISAEHLDIFYEHLVALYIEMSVAVSTILGVVRLLPPSKRDARKGIEAIIQDGIAQVHLHQQKHKSLPPLPRFPQESPTPPSDNL